MSNKGRGAGQKHTASALSYRADIDGLRAVAIIGVLGYHFGLGVPGGYGGVDVFFVISGFLIAGIIKAELEAQTFSLSNFYVRRVRRILPALTVCLLVSSIVAGFILFPRDFQNFGRSVLAAATSTSNFFFMQRTGYFDDASLEKPLLHTWSLGVEEQFYVVFPLTLMLLFRFAKASSARHVLAAVVILSFAYSCYVVAHAPEKAFFSTVGRAWELGFGALVAFGALPMLTQRWMREAEAAIGVLSIAGAYAFFSDATPFPGVAATPLCLGAAFVIHSGMTRQPTAVAKALSFAPMVGIGLISYSVYLWHWPMLVFSAYRFPAVFGPGAPHVGLAYAALAIASIFVGALSWRFIEEPFRRTKASQRKVFSVGAAAALATAVVAGLIVERPGWVQHWPSDIQAMQFRKTVSGRVLGLKRAPSWPQPTYLAGPADSELDTVLWGDSFAQALIPGFIDYQKRTGQGAILAADPGCPPLLGVAFYPGTDDARCSVHNDAVFKRLTVSPVRRVLLSARWSRYVRDVTRDGRGRPVVYGKGGHADGAAFAVVLEGLIRRLTAQNKEVILIGPVPEQAFDVTPAIARHIAWGAPLPSVRSVEAFEAEEHFVLSLFSRLATIPHVRVVYPHLILCDGKTCPYSSAGKPLYSDAAHLSAVGAKKLSPMFDEIFAESARS